MDACRKIRGCGVSANDDVESVRNRANHTPGCVFHPAAAAAEVAVPISDSPRRSSSYPSRSESPSRRPVRGAARFVLPPAANSPAECPAYSSCCSKWCGPPAPPLLCPDPRSIGRHPSRRPPHSTSHIAAPRSRSALDIQLHHKRCLRSLKRGLETRHARAGRARMKTVAETVFPPRIQNVTRWWNRSLRRNPPPVPGRASPLPCSNTLDKKPGSSRPRQLRCIAIVECSRGAVIERVKYAAARHWQVGRTVDRFQPAHFPSHPPRQTPGFSTPLPPSSTDLSIAVPVDASRVTTVAMASVPIPVTILVRPDNRCNSSVLLTTGLTRLKRP